MKISKRDKFEALKRIQGFQDDCDKRKQLNEEVVKQCLESIDDDKLWGAYVEVTHLALSTPSLPEDYCTVTKPHEKAVSALKTHEKAVKERWNLAGPLPPFDVMGLSVDVISPLATHKQALIGEIYEGYDPVKLSRSAAPLSLKFNYHEGKHLCMIADLTRTEEELIKEFKENIKRYKKLLPEEKVRNKPTTSINIWQVYDMCHNDKKNLNQIAQELSGIKDNPAYNSTLMAWYKKVKRAYAKAKEIVKAVDT